MKTEHKILFDNKALIDGGFVLRSMDKNTNWETSDIDIYVNQKNSKNVLEYLTNIYYLKEINEDFEELKLAVSRNKHFHQAPPYDMSFLRKNRIIHRTHFWMKFFDPVALAERGRGLDSFFSRSIDLMIVEDDMNLTDLCSNFDLTFCEIWWNGKEVSTWSPQNMIDIKNKKGNLRQEYQESLFKHFNTFIAERIKKYVSRGFEINFNCKSGVLTKAVKSITSPNDYLVFEISNSIYNCMNKVRNQFSDSNINIQSDKDYNNLLTKNLLSNNANIESLERMINQNDFISKSDFLDGPDFSLFNELDKFKRFCLLSMFYSSILNIATIKYLEYKKDNVQLKIFNDFFGIDFLSIAYNFEEYMYNYKYNFNELIKLLYLLPTDYLGIIIDILETRNAKKEITLKYTPSIEIKDECFDFLYTGNREVILDPNQKKITEKLTEINKKIGEARKTQNIPEIIKLNGEINKFMEKHGEVLKNINKIQDSSHKFNEEHLKNKENFILVVDKDTIICYNVEDLLRKVSDYKTWLLECNGILIEGAIDKNIDGFSKNGPFYSGITIDETPMNAYFDVLELIKIVELVRNQDNKIFYVKEKIVDNEVLHFSHTISYANSFGPHDFIGTNHCQHGSKIIVYEIFLPEQ